MWVRRYCTDVDMDMDMVTDMDKGGWAEWAEEGAGVEPTGTDKMGARGEGGNTTPSLGLGATT